MVNIEKNNAENLLENTNKSRLKSIFTNQLFFLIAIMIIISIIVTIVNPNFLSVQNLFNIILQVSVTGIICVGLAMILITGEFDLSIGPVISILGLVMAILITRYSILLTIIVVILLGMAIGAINGFLVTRIRAHSFIVTLALSTIYAGIALLISGGKYIPLQGRFKFFSEKLFNVIPYPVIVLIVVLIIAFIVFKYVKFGRLLFAIGGNAQAAYLSGVKVRLNKIITYTVAGGIYAIATIVLISQISVAYPTTGEPYTMTALAAIVVGGVSLTGGKGSALGIFLGALVFGLINNSMILMNINPYWREVVLGIVILLAVAISGLTSKD